MAKAEPQETNAKHYTVGEVAHKVGVSPQTLRVWERRGLLVPARSKGGHRIYADSDLQRAHQVALLRKRQGWNPAAILAGATFETTREAWSHLSIGARIRAVRRSRGVSVRQLAGHIGISVSHLSTLERGESGITAQLLSKVADALGVPNTALSTPVVDYDAEIIRAGEGPRTIQGDGVVWEELGPPGRVLGPAILVVPPGGASGGAYSRPGEVFIHILSGSLTFNVVDEQREIVLSEGDSLHLLPKHNWMWNNPGDRQSRALYVEEVPKGAWE